MKKLSDFINEDAMFLLADILDPISIISKDEKLKDSKKSKLALAQYLLRNHPKEIIKILAIMNDENPDTFKCNPITLISQIVNILNESDLMNLFTSVEQIETSSSSASMK